MNKKKDKAFVLDEDLLEIWDKHSVNDRVALIEDTNHAHRFKADGKTKPQDNIESYNNALKNLSDNPVFIELLDYPEFKIFYDILCSGGAPFNAKNNLDRLHYLNALFIAFEKTTQRKRGTLNDKQIKKCMSDINEKSKELQKDIEEYRLLTDGAITANIYKEVSATLDTLAKIKHQRSTHANYKNESYFIFTLVYWLQFHGIKFKNKAIADILETIGIEFYDQGNFSRTLNDIKKQIEEERDTNFNHYREKMS